jgi:hypothetical protein
MPHFDPAHALCAQAIREIEIKRRGERHSLSAAETLELVFASADSPTIPTDATLLKIGVQPQTVDQLMRAFFNK